MADRSIPPSKLRVALKRITPTSGGTGGAAASSAAAASGGKPASASADPYLKKVQDNVQAALDKLAAKVDAVNTSVSVATVPIGAIIFVDTDMPNVPAVPSNFQLCDGATITDKRSPMVGQATRNMMTGGAGGVSLFIRSGSPTGTVQAADSVVPAHAHSLNAHTHGVGTFAVGTHTHLGGTLNWSHQHQISTSGTTGTVYSAVSAVNRTMVGTSPTAGQNLTDVPDVTHGQNSWTGASGGTQPTFTGTSAGPSVANTATDGNSGAETRPANMFMKPYVRIW